MSTDPRFGFEMSEGGEPNPRIYFDDYIAENPHSYTPFEAYLEYIRSVGQFQLIVNGSRIVVFQAIGVGGDDFAGIYVSDVAGTGKAALVFDTYHETANPGAAQYSGKLHAKGGQFNARPYWTDGAGNVFPVGIPMGNSLTPIPTMPSSNVAQPTLLVAAGTGYVGQVFLPCAIPASQLRYNVSSPGVSGTGTMRCVLWTCDGQNKILDVTDAVDTNSGIRTIAFSELLIPAGCYYQGIGMAADSYATRPTVSMWSTLDTFQDGGSGFADLEGTMTWTGGAAPATFSPDGDISTSNDRVPMFQLQAAL